MGSYYYLTAQLPFLIYEQKPPMSSSSFKALAGSLMLEEDAVFLDVILLDTKPRGGSDGSYAEPAPLSGCDFIDNWREWERVLRLNLAKHRAIKIKRDVSAFEPPCYPADAASVAVKAVNGELSPLETEIFIDKARWNAIDALAGNNYFDRNIIFAYFLKLLLLERRQLFNVERGFAEYKSLYADIIESAQNAGEHK